jgi:hypothetical protein
MTPSTVPIATNLIRPAAARLTPASVGGAHPSNRSPLGTQAELGITHFKKAATGRAGQPDMAGGSPEQDRRVLARDCSETSPRARDHGGRAQRGDPRERGNRRLGAHTLARTPRCGHLAPSGPDAGCVEAHPTVGRVGRSGV